MRDYQAFEERLLAFGNTHGVTRANLISALEAIPSSEVLVLADPTASCDFDSTTLQYADGRNADGNAFLRLNLFVRLWRKLGWTMGETDAALRTFVPAESPFGNALRTGLIYIAHLKSLDEALRTGKSSREKLTAIWANLGTFGSGSLYAQLFLRPTVLKADDVFDHPYGDYLSEAWISEKARDRWFEVHLEDVAPADQINSAHSERILFSYDEERRIQRLSVKGVLTDEEKAELSQSPMVGLLLDAAQLAGREYGLLKGHLVALQRALGLTAEEVRIVLEDAGKSLDSAVLSLEHVTLLYRYALLARGLKLSMPELIALKQLSGLDPFKPLHSGPISSIEGDHPFSETLGFVETVENVKQSSFKVEDLDYLLRHRFDETGKYRPDRAHTAGLFKSLADGIERIRSEHPIPPDPESMSEEELLQKDRLIRQLVVQALIADTAAEPELVESLLTDVQMLGMPKAAPKPLLTALSEGRGRGVEVEFFASEDASGSAICTLVVPTADTDLKDGAVPLRPAEAKSARFDGYLEVPTAGAYRIFVELDKKDAKAEVRFDHLPGGQFWSGKAGADGAVLGGKPTEYLELEPGTPYRFSITLQHLGGRDARVRVQGETLPKGPLSQLVLSPARSFEAAVELLTKVLALAQGLRLKESELRYLLTHASSFCGLDLKALPTSSGGVSLKGAKKLFDQFLRLLGYVRARSVLSEGTDDLIAVFKADEAGKEIGDPGKVYATIAKLARRDSDVVRDAAKALQTLSDFDNERPLLRLWEALEAIERIGVSVASVVGWTRIVDNRDSGQSFAIARDLADTIKAGSEPEEWQRIAKPIFDKLRKRQRDALSSYVMHQRGFTRLEQLYEYFLIDPGMEPVIQTSRIRLATASVQLFVQRCLLNLEADVPPAGLINAAQWEWMKRYRVWEANRKIFLFPENWLEPEFRDDKTHIFRELESTLLSGDVSNDLAEDAFLAYLRKLEELARLNIVAMHIENKIDPAQNTLHVIGRTYAEPYKYFYRRYVGQMWTPWEPVTAEIEGDHLAPVVWRDRLYLFWVTFVEKPAQRASESLDLTDTEDLTVKVESDLEAQLHWSEYLNGEWLTRESGGPSTLDDQRITATWRDGNKFDKDIRSISVHVSKERDGEAGEERGVFVHLGDPFENAFYLESRNSLPEKRKRKEVPDNVYSSSIINATQYLGKADGGQFTVSFAPHRETSQSSSTGEKKPLAILGNTGKHSILTADHDIDLHPDLASIAARDPTAVKAAIKAGLNEVAALTKPIFYQDSRNTLFVEPRVTERTVEEWDEWLTRMPGPLKLLDLDKTFVHKQFPIPDLAGPIVSVRINPDPYSKRQVQDGSDWLVNSGTAILYDNNPIGARGRLDVRVLAHEELATAVASGEVTVPVHPASSLPAGDTGRLVGDAKALAQAGLTSAAGGLNLVGPAGMNAALGEHLAAISGVSSSKAIK
ncbi:neuraminidase-like domain-containing protein [Vulgatibacter incomptus]|nr:neuraminidase-like domain-containing protein [Vulgatibacter incomptus]